jgi:transcriptional regulator with XRE-family HTH domain
VNSKSSDQQGGEREEAAGAESLGAQLRRAREARNLTLREISDQTRITRRHLEAIEADDYRQLPGGIFNRSFVKAFARAVSFDEKRAMDLYARQLRERGENPDEPATTPHRSRVYTDGDVGRSPALTFALSALLVGILCLGIYALWRAYEKRYGGASNDANAAAQKAAGQPAAPTPAPTAEVSLDELRVRLTAKDKSFWVTSRLDGKPNSGMLVPGTPKDFRPAKALYLKVDSKAAQNLEVLINDRAATLPAAASGSNEIEMNISKETARQYLP